MIEFEFDKYTKNVVDADTLSSKYLSKKKLVLEEFSKSTMTGWMREVPQTLIEEILKVRDEIKSRASVLVVIGIGGSFLGSYALNQIFSKKYAKGDTEVIYLGNGLDSESILDTFKYLEDKDFYIDVISKSGETTEIMITYSLMKEFMKKKYSSEEIRERTIVTTDKEKGRLLQEALNNGYRTFEIPRDIGGRYSLMTAAHLLPLSFNLDIDKLVSGYELGLNLVDEAYYYAALRRYLFDEGKYIESFSVYQENFSYYLEWLKQLFGETEGKNKKGIFPVSMIGTRDLHSLGQFVQEGNPIIFETFIKILETSEVKYKNCKLNDINNLVLESVKEAHALNSVPATTIILDKVSEENMGELSAFMMLSAAYSGYLFEVEPFNQPGVEIYKKILKEKMQELEDETI